MNEQIIAQITWDPAAVLVGDRVVYTQRVDARLKHYNATVLKVLPYHPLHMVDLHLTDPAAVVDGVMLTHFGVSYHGWREHGHWTWEHNIWTPSL